MACSLCHEIELNAWNHDILETACWHIAVIHPDAAKAAGLLRCINAPAKILNPHIESASGTEGMSAGLLSQSFESLANYCYFDHRGMHIG